MDSPGGYLIRTATNIFRKLLTRGRFLSPVNASLTPRTTSPAADSALVLNEALRVLAPTWSL
jgi:hypothetical protein